MTNTEIDWQAIGKALRQPFNPTDVDFRPQGNPNANGNAQAVCYVDARVIADRLDEVVGPGAWAFRYEPLVIDKGQVQIAKGVLMIHGVSKEDVGEASNFDPSKGCVSDALKRAAVLWGIGRYLYGVGSEWVKLDQYKRIPDDVVQRLRAKLPKPTTQNAPHSTSRDNPAAQTKHATPTPPTPPAASSAQAQPSTDPMALTHASPIDQKKLSGQLAARWPAVEAQSGFLRNVTRRAIDADKLRDGRSDISLDELLRANERLTHMPAPAQANGKAATR